MGFAEECFGVAQLCDTYCYQVDIGEQSKTTQFLKLLVVEYNWADFRYKD